MYLINICEIFTCTVKRHSCQKAKIFLVHNVPWCPKLHQCVCDLHQHNNFCGVYREEIISSLWSKEPNNDPFCFSQTYKPHSWWKVFERFSQMDAVLKRGERGGAAGPIPYLIQRRGAVINRFDPSLPDGKGEFWPHFSENPEAIPANGPQHMERCVCAWKQRLVKMARVFLKAINDVRCG